MLDEYEGAEFERRAVAVRMADGSTLDAWTYFYTLDTSGKSRIESDDYLQPTA